MNPPRIPPMSAAKPARRRPCSTTLLSSCEGAGCSPRRLAGADRGGGRVSRSSVRTWSSMASGTVGARANAPVDDRDVDVEPRIAGRPAVKAIVPSSDERTVGDVARSATKLPASERAAQARAKRQVRRTARRVIGPTAPIGAFRPFRRKVPQGEGSSPAANRR